MTVERVTVRGKREPVMPYDGGEGARGINVRFLVSLVLSGRSPEYMARHCGTTVTAVREALAWADRRLVWSDEEMAEQRPERGEA